MKATSSYTQQTNIQKPVKGRGKVYSLIQRWKEKGGFSPPFLGALKASKWLKQLPEYWQHSNYILAFLGAAK